MSRGRKKHHGIEISGWVLVFVGLAGAVFGYRDRLVFAVAGGLAIGILIGFLIGNRAKGKSYHYYNSPEPQSSRAEMQAPRPRRREISRAQRNGWEAPEKISDRMILLSPECRGRTNCRDCHDKRCQCPCKHDPASILAWNTWNTERYDEEHEPEKDLAEALTEPDDDEFPF